jgi:hydroxyacylglutathione hydrolase
MIEVFKLRALTDNYIFILRDNKSLKTAVVDPSDATPVIEFLKSKNWRIDFIFNTHHHHDHVGGNLELKSLYACEVLASKYDAARIPGITKTLQDNDEFFFGEAPCRVIATPGHTLGAIVYYFQGDGLAFTGDTLFTLGCGRLFEGTAPMLWASLQRLSQELSPQTRIYSGHEYGLQNAGFALYLRPESPETKAFWQSMKSGAPSVPSTLQQELQLNPFIKARNVDDFADIRRQKDDFRLDAHPALR